jgi:hypothetical protein
VTVTALPSGVQRIVGQLQAASLPVVYGGPDLIGSACPLCPARLAPFGTKYIKASMVVEFGGGGVRYSCEGSCTSRDIGTALRSASPARISAAA